MECGETLACVECDATERYRSEQELWVLSSGGRNRVEV